jgi:hypothetical protein
MSPRTGAVSPAAWLLWCVAVFVGSLELGWWLFWRVLGH